MPGPLIFVAGFVLGASLGVLVVAHLRSAAGTPVVCDIHADGDEWEARCEGAPDQPCGWTYRGASRSDVMTERVRHLMQAHP